MLITTDPITIVDRNTAARIINAVIMKYYIAHNFHKDWVYDAIEELREDYSINVVANSLRKVLVDLKKGKRDSRAASLFSGKISTRSEKDGMYREFESVVAMSLSSRDYVGLPANQLVHVVRNNGSVVACEKNKNMFEFMSQLKNCFVPNENVELVREDILNYLPTRCREFSVFDIDLMTYVNKHNLIERLATGIHCSAQRKAAICLVTCYGRKISKQKYEEMMPQELIERLRNNGWRIRYSKSGEYVDQIVPMKYEFLVIER